MAGPWGVRLREPVQIRPGREQCTGSAGPTRLQTGLCAPGQNPRLFLWQTRRTVDAPLKGPILTDHDLVLVVDFGAQYAQLIARRVREAKVYSEIVPHSMPVAEMLARKPAAIILSGGPSSVYAPGAPHVDADLFEAGVPVFGMCYGFQAMAQVLGGEVAHTGISEFGRTPVRVTSPGTLLADIPAEHRVWMSHGDSVRRAPDGFDVLAATTATPVAAFENTDRRLAGVQWHPEVLHTEHGQKVLEHFLHRHRRLPAHLDDGQHRRGADRAHPRADRRLRPGDLRAVRRRRLGGRRGRRTACDRGPAHLRLRRPRAAAQGRGRAGRARLRRRHRRRPARRGRREALPRRARGGQRPRGEAQDHRPRVHPGLRGGRGRRARQVDGRGGHQGRLPRPGHPLPRRRRVRRGSGHLQHQVPPQRRRAARRPRVRASSSRCARCSRTRSASSASSSACPPRSSGGTRSRARASRSGSSARSTGSASTSCARPTRSPARS